MRRLYLVRHGETEGQSSIRLNGRTDVRLSDEGREQVRRLGPRLAAERFAALVHSPLARAVESASILLDTLATRPQRIEVDPELTEVDFGDFEEMTLDEVESSHPDWYRAWQVGEVDGYPGGESIAGFRARVRAAFVHLLSRHPDGDLLVVAHKGVIKQGIAALCGLDAAAVRALPMELGSLWMLRGREDWRVELENVTG